MTNRIKIFSLLLVLHTPTYGEQLVLMDATIIDPAAAEPQYRGSILIDDGVITAVLAADATEFPENARLVDVSGKYIIPGLIDTHNHLSFGHDTVEWGPDRVLDFLPQWGVTTVFDTTISMKNFNKLKAEEKSASSRTRFFAAGRSIGAKDGWGGTLTGGYTPETVEEARAAVRELVGYGVDGIKLVYDDMTVFGVGPWPVLDDSLVAAIIDEAHEHGLKAFVHAPKLENAKEALRYGADALIHGIIDEPIDDEFLELMRRNGAVYAPTHVLYEQGANKPAMSHRYDVMDIRSLIDRSVYESLWASKRQNPVTGAKLPVLRENLRIVVNAGLPVAIGSDTGVRGVLAGVASQMELVLFVESAMDPVDALRAATSTAAELIGQQDRLGQIKPGMYADLVILEESPLADIRNIQTIWAVLIDGDFAVSPRH